MAVYEQPRFLESGISCVVVEFADCIDRQANSSVQLLKERVLKAFAPHCILECVPTYRSLAINYDPLRLTQEQLLLTVKELLQENMQHVTATSRKVIRVPVCYGGEHAPDLDSIAAHTGLSKEQVVARHHEPTYYCYMLGFTPGFCYIGGMDSSLETPRLANPRTSIPMGSVGIAGKQTGIYPIASPGGWQLLGRTPLRLFDPQRKPITLIQAGDWVRFYPIDPSEFDCIERDVLNGSYTPICEEEPMP